MKPSLYIFLLLITSNFVLAQDNLEWSENSKLTFEDFKSNSTEIGSKIIELQSGVSIEFDFQMSNIQFMFTKNFNSKVNCVFHKNAASIVAPNKLIATKLVNFSQFQFDLAELYSRKLRAKLYESKKISSEPSFYKSIYQDIQNQYSNRNAEVSKLTELGQKEQVLKDLHSKVLEEIKHYPDYCKTCKPNKR